MDNIQEMCGYFYTVLLNQAWPATMAESDEELRFMQSKCLRDIAERESFVRSLADQVAQQQKELAEARAQMQAAVARRGALEEQFRVREESVPVYDERCLSLMTPPCVVAWGCAGSRTVRRPCGATRRLSPSMRP